MSTLLGRQKTPNPALVGSFSCGWSGKRREEKKRERDDAWGMFSCGGVAKEEKRRRESEMTLGECSLEGGVAKEEKKDAWAKGKMGWAYRSARM